MHHRPILFFRLHLILCLLFSLSVPCSAEIVKFADENTARASVSARNNTLAEALQAKLARLSAWNYQHEPEFNIDSFNEELNHDMVAYLSEKSFPMDENTVNLERIASADSLLTIYSYQYSSGGTAGAINTSIIQWKKSGGKFGAKILELPAHFYESHILSQTKQHTLYLFLGGWKGSSRLEVSVAPVIELSGDSLSLAYPAFYRKYPYLKYYDDIYTPENYCIACIDYLPAQKKLVIENLGSEDRVGVQARDESSFRDYLKGQSRLSYTFDGKQFVED